MIEKTFPIFNLNADKTVTKNTSWRWYPCTLAWSTTV